MLSRRFSSLLFFLSVTVARSAFAQAAPPASPEPADPAPPARLPLLAAPFDPLPLAPGAPAAPPAAPFAPPSAPPPPMTTVTPLEPPSYAPPLPPVEPDLEMSKKPRDLPGPRFGTRGEFVVTGSSTAGIASTQYSASSASRFSANFSPGLDYFVIDDLSIGFTLDASFTDQKGYSGSLLTEEKHTSFSIAPRVGWNLPLGKLASLYPRFAFGFALSHDENVVADGQGTSLSTDYSGVWLNLFVPLLLHPSPHFFVGAGPRLVHDFRTFVVPSSALGQGTVIDGEFVLGGWWGGPEVPEKTADDPGWSHDGDPSSRPVRRFGDENEVLFTGEAALSVSSTQYSVSGSATSVQVAPGFDYFPFRDVSIGLNAYASSGSASGIDARGVGGVVAPGTTYTTHTTGYGAAAHVGVNIPLGRAFSLCPRAYIGIGGTTSNLTEGSAQAQSTGSESWVSLYVPLLVHPAQHFCVGFGPSLQHDLSNDTTYQGTTNAISNTSTTVGASLMVGGWL